MKGIISQVGRLESGLEAVYERGELEECPSFGVRVINVFSFIALVIRLPVGGGFVLVVVVVVVVKQRGSPLLSFITAAPPVSLVLVRVYDFTLSTSIRPFCQQETGFRFNYFAHTPASYTFIHEKLAAIISRRCVSLNLG